MVKSIHLITLVLIILLNNCVNSQVTKCSIDDPNSCKNVKSFYNKIYNEAFICSHLDTINDTICVPKTMATCKTDKDCQGEEFKSIHKDFSFCYVSPHYNVTTKQCFIKHSENGYCLDNIHCNPEYNCINNQCHLINDQSLIKFKRNFNSDMLIICLCIIIPLIFVCLVIGCVVYAKKYYERAELKNSQSTNLSSFSSINYNSKNIMYSRGSNTNNGSGIHNSGLNFENFHGDPYHSNSSSNNYSNSNNSSNNNYYYNSNKINYLSNNDNNLNFNQQLLMTKNYRLQGQSVNSLGHSINLDTSSPKLFGVSDNIIKENDITSDYKGIKGNQDINEVKINYSSVTRSNSQSKQAKISSLPKQPPRTLNGKKKINDENLNYNIKMSSPLKENRVSVSPPLRDWNDTYNTVDSDSYREKKVRSNYPKHEQKSNETAYSPRMYENEKTYRDYFMALATNKMHNQYGDYNDSEDITLKSPSFSSTSSNTLVQDKQLYNNVLYIQEKPSYYSRNYRENIY